MTSGDSAPMQAKDETSQLLAWQDLPAALGLLSRLPVRVDMAAAQARGAAAVWAYPLAGTVIATIACVVGQVAIATGLPAALTAGLVIATLVIVTGAMHEDGLADSADGLWGGWDKARRLEIMKDSHIGTYGVLALVLSVGLRWGALVAVIEAGLLWPVLIGTAAMSRAAMVGVMFALPNARTGGLSRSIGRPPRAATGLALGVGGAVWLGLMGAAVGSAVWAGGPLLSVLVTAVGCALIAKAKIGGQTGDILGASQQVTEITALLAVAAHLSAA